MFIWKWPQCQTQRLPQDRARRELKDNAYLRVRLYIHAIAQSLYHDPILISPFLSMGKLSELPKIMQLVNSRAES